MNKYQEALEILCTYADGNPSSSGEFVGKMLQEADDTLQELIKEHFELKEKYSKILDDVHDYRHETHTYQATIRNLMKHFGVTTIKELTSIYYNRPLKFEELEGDMWVWDNLMQRYMKIEKVILEESIYYHAKTIIEYIWYEPIPFEENRFYRYEVKE